MQNTTGAIVERAARGVRSLMGLQLITRVLTFLLNVAIIRKVDHSVAGANGIQLPLLLALCLNLSRECTRRTFARVTPGDVQRVVNISWVSVPLGLVITPVVCFWMSSSSSSSVIAVPVGYQPSVWIYGLAAFVELSSEPLSSSGQFEQRYSVRLVVESSAAVIRCVLSFVLVKFFPTFLPPLVSLSLGQLAFAVVLFVGYAADALLGGSPLLPRRTAVGDFIGTALVRLSVVYQWQTVQKIVLTEGEKFVLVFSESLVNQGVYSVVNNLASLVVRFVFQPVEEVCFTAFGKLASSGRADAPATARRVLSTVLRLMTIVGLCFVCFGPAFSHLAIDFLYTSKYSQTAAPAVLAWYCLYILLVAVNGTTEAFVHSVASESELRTFNILLVAFSAIFVIVASIFVRVPGVETIGLVWANSIS